MFCNRSFSGLVPEGSAAAEAGLEFRKARISMAAGRQKERRSLETESPMILHLESRLKEGWWATAAVADFATDPHTV
jgi:hypothetical protein